MPGSGAFAGGPTPAIDAGSGPVVVLVHGQPGAGGDWSAIAGLLAHDHRVIAPDRPGWGRDTRPAAGLSANAEALEETLQAALAPGPVTVVGHSLGGGVALELALGHPERVGALVLIGSVGVAEALSGFDRLLAVPMVGDGILRAGTAALRRGLNTARRYSQLHPDAAVARRMAAISSLQSAIGSQGGPMLGRSRQSFLVEQRALLAETPQLEARLEEISVPAAVVTGASDRVVPVSAARALAGRLPRAELFILPGGHLLPFEKPEQVAQLVRRYAALGSHLRDGPRRRGTPEA